jgi:hypothetical protein
MNPRGKVDLVGTCVDSGGTLGPALQTPREATPKQIRGVAVNARSQQISNFLLAELEPEGT